MRRRLPPLLAFGLAILTAVTLLRAGAAITAGRTVTDGAAVAVAADQAVVARFYDAVNVALRTGDATLLDAVVAPDFLDHEPASDVTRGRGALDHALAVLRRRAPGVQLTVATVAADGRHADQVMAAVTAGRTAIEALADGLDGRSAIAWGPVDRFRVADGRVVERWGGMDDVALRQPLLRARVDAIPRETPDLRLVRLTLAPGASLPRVASLAPTLLAIEAGTLTAQIGGPDQAASGVAAVMAGPPGTPQPWAATPLQPGDQLVIPARTVCDLRNDTTTPVVALAVVLLPAESGSGSSSQDHVPGLMLGLEPAGDPARPDGSLVWRAGITVQPLGGGVVDAWPRGRANVVLTRVTLAPGASATDSPGTTLLAVEAGTGTLALVNGHGDIQVTRAVSPWVAATPTTALPNTGARFGAGNAAFIPSGDVGTVQNAARAPLVVLALTVAPITPSDGMERSAGGTPSGVVP